MKFIYIILLLSILSCSDRDSGGFKQVRDNFTDGYHKAYVKILNTENFDSKEATAEVYIENTLVKKICFKDTECVENFDFWDDSYIYYQQVFAKNGDPKVYSVYVIPDSDEQFEEDEPQYDDRQ